MTYYMSNKFKVTHYDIDNAKVPDSLKLKKSIILADFHNALFGNNNEHLLNEIEVHSPDYIIIPGDMFNSDGNYDNSLSLLKQLCSRYKVYYSEGNHELKLRSTNNSLYNTIRDIVPDYLDNSSANLCSHVKIYGIDIDKSFYGRFIRPRMTDGYMTKKLGNPCNNCYNILVAHTPAYMKFYSSWGADLVISGHYHGGFVRIPGIGGVMSPQCMPFPRYSGGKYKCNKTDVVVSRGLGSHTIPLRIFNPPELIVLHFK